MGRAHCHVLFLHYRLIIEIKAEAREIKNGEGKNPTILELKLDLEFILLFLVGGGPVFHIDFLSICD